MESEFSVVDVNPEEAALQFDEHYEHILQDVLFTECIADRATAERVLNQLREIFIEGSSGVKAVFKVPAEEATEEQIKNLEPLKKMAKDTCDQMSEMFWIAQLNFLVPMAHLLVEQDAKIQKRVLN